uniref:Uncharacterized protein n=1 Tax=Sinocyclocheilus anshuiensis TaxID=1608454 RepID=A0A671LBA9_9TELE
KYNYNSFALQRIKINEKSVYNDITLFRPMCVCERISFFKKSNVKRHFETQHAAFAAKYPVGESRKKACAELYFAWSLEIARPGKPFTDGKYVKSCMLNMATELFADFPNKDTIIQKIKDVPRTVHDRAVKMASEIERVQINDITSADFFSLALDESTDICNTAQLSIVGRYVSGDIIREAILPMKLTTKGEEVLKVFMDFATEKKLPLDKLVSVCTDGAPSMVGKRKGFVSLLCEQEKRHILHYHCALHQQALCAQSCGPELRDVISLVIRVVNFIVARALNEHHLLLHSNVRWLSKGRVLARFAACLDEVKAFLEKKGITHPELTDQDWLCKFYYLVDITGHLNQLNVRMQGHGNTQLVSFTSKLLMSFQERFRDFRAHRNLFKFITHPHETTLDDDQLSVIPGTSTASFELETVELKSAEIWSTKFVTLNAKLESIICECEHLAKEHNTAFLTMFGSTYTCEQSFSHMNNIKSNQRSVLTDESLNACMKLNSTTYEPDYKAIIVQGHK